MDLFPGLNAQENKTDKVTAEDILPPSDPEGRTLAGDTQREYALNVLAGRVEEKYQIARVARASKENIWLDAFRLWRGQHSPDQTARIAELRARNPYSSSVFIKSTTTKCTVAIGQIQEIVFQNDQLPISVEPTKVPEGIADVAFMAPEEPAIKDIYGYAGDGKTIEPGATYQTLLGGMYSKIKKGLGSLNIFEGTSPDHTKYKQIHPAQEAADKMQKTIHDQLDAGDFQKEVRKVIWEQVVYGTGILEGPYTYTKTSHYWASDKNGQKQYDPRVTDIPRFYFVSVWDFYPDPASTCIEDCEYLIRRRRLSRSEVSGLRRIAGFNQTAISALLMQKPNRVQEYWESTTRETDTFINEERYDIKEFWGYLAKEDLQDLEEFKDKLEDGVDQFHVNIWVCGNIVLRAIVNPFVPARFPYYAVPYQENLNSIFGVGVPENCKDSQELMNAHYRMMVDNLALAGSCVLEIDTTNLEPGQDMKIYPGKAFYKQAGAPGQAINSINFQNTAQSHMMAMDKARQQMDEASNLFSQSYGNSTTMGSNRTASGMSMLMSAAASAIKQVVRNLDVYLFQPVGQAAFSWNMQFNDDVEVIGDVNIVARGTAAIMQREVRSQRLIQMQQVAGQNPAMAARLNNDYILEELAKSLDLDKDKILNDDDTYFKILQSMGGQQGQQMPPQPGQPVEPTGAGGGNMGVGQVPQQGEPGFAANTGGQV